MPRKKKEVIENVEEKVVEEVTEKVVEELVEKVVEKPVEFGYEAKLPSSEPIQETTVEKQFVKVEDPHKNEMRRRLLKNLKLNSDTWNALIFDIKNGIGKQSFVRKYRIKAGYFKYIKEFINGK